MSDWMKRKIGKVLENMGLSVRGNSRYLCSHRIISVPIYNVRGVTGVPDPIAHDHAKPDRAQVLAERGRGSERIAWSLV